MKYLEKRELTIGDLIFLADTFKVVTEAIKGQGQDDVEDLILQCEELINEAGRPKDNEALTKFQRDVENVGWRKA